MEFQIIRQFLLLLVCMRCIIPTKAEVIETESAVGSNNFPTTENAAVATTIQSYRRSRWYRHGYNDKQNNRGGYNGEDDYHEDHDMDIEDMGAMKAITQPKVDYWNGYYDFLINEGSYKFWAVFQLATAALLIYSGFAALYYAKVNPTPDDDYDDYFLRRRRRRSFNRFFNTRPFLGLSPETFQRIIDAVENEFH